MTHIGKIEVTIENKDFMDNICICPHCGDRVRYGNMMMYCGIHSCPKCHESLHNEIEKDKANDYDNYVYKANNGIYEPFKYREN